LVFKDRSAQPAAPEPPLPGTASFASLRLQQRNEIMESDRQRVKPLLRISFVSKRLSSPSNHREPPKESTHVSPKKKQK
ncbi:hypothetical protein, partial [Paraburkholderia atlantica]|uniref:hypothetical protein n=1 Tax=Paraburkholderia atlantica TaxID=2654982 RepID=UPI001C8496CF